VLWVRKSGAQKRGEHNDPLLSKRRQHTRCSTADEEDDVEQKVAEARAKAMLAVEQKVQQAEAEARRQAMAEADEEVRITRIHAEVTAKQAKARRIAARLAKKQAAAAAANATTAAAYATSLAEVAAEEIVCEFDLASGFALNGPARAACVQRWKQDVGGSGDVLLQDGARPEVRVDFDVLSKATNNFDEDAFLLGRGGCCRVFKGEVYGYPAAIKVFEEASGAWDDQQIESEIEMLCRTRHPHINKLLAVSFNGPYRCLILELMDGGALDDRLKNNSLPVLQWQERARILLHIARGLVYMHSLNPPVVHRDVKTGNVLLQYIDRPEDGAGAGMGAGADASDIYGSFRSNGRTGSRRQIMAKVSDFGE
jgi:serine/threonine protein kinase